MNGTKQLVVCGGNGNVLG